MKVLIVEDEMFSAKRLQHQLVKLDDSIEVLDIISSVEKCVLWFQNNEEPDLLFLDIHLEDQKSFELFKEINITTPVIYTTAYEEYALQAFKQNSVDYLLKPIDINELENAINKYKLRFIADKKTEFTSIKERFLVKKGSQYVSILVSNIAYFKSEQKLIFLVTNKNEKFVIDQPLDQLINILDPKLFYRISRNRLIGIDSIAKIHAHFNGRLKLELLPPENEDVFVSRERVAGFKQWLGN